MAVSTGLEWNEKALVAEATAAARKAKRQLEFDSTRFVAYSFPKVGVQFLAKGKEVLLLELKTWAPVPPARKDDRKPLEPSHFERWSLLEELPAAARGAATRRYNARVKALGTERLRKLDTSVISKGVLENVVAISLIDTRELHYSGDNATHHTCYELHGQLTNVWCVAASTQMLLDFWRYNYTQDRIDRARPRDARRAERAALRTRRRRRHADRGALLSRARRDDGDEPRLRVLPRRDPRQQAADQLHPGALTDGRGLLPVPVRAGGPDAVSGTAGYDPWPPTTGVITRWENFDTQTYQYGYSAHVTIVP